ncbi:unnamed protein product, partial [Closterium sp. NIES-54]
IILQDTPIVLSKGGPPVVLSKGGPPVVLSKGGPPVVLSKGGPPVVLSKGGPPVVLSKGGPPIVLSKGGPPVVLSKGGPPVIILYDTPGVLSKSMHKLDELMMQAVRTATVNADAVVLVIDITQAPQEVSKLLLEGMESAVVQKKPTLIVLNKKDSLKPGEVAKKLKWYQDAVAADGHMVIALSAKRGDGVDGLLAWMLDNIPQGPAYYPKDVVSELPERFFVAEIVREKILLQYSQEVPYACQVAWGMGIEGWAMGCMHGTWGRGHGAWDMGQGTWSMGHGAGGTEHGTWGRGHGAWDMGQGARGMGHGAGDTEHGTWGTGQAWG